MKRWAGLGAWMVWLGLGLGLGLGTGSAQTTGCVLKKQTYTCDRASFQTTLNAAKTVRVEADAQDRMAGAELRGLVVSLGKAVVGTEDVPDLTISLVPRSTDGVLIGPAGVDLAVLRVYGRGVDGGRGNLVWAETYTGQPDRSWASVVQATINQFRAGLKR